MYSVVQREKGLKSSICPQGVHTYSRSFPVIMIYIGDVLEKLFYEKASRIWKIGSEGIGGKLIWDIGNRAAGWLLARGSEKDSVWQMRLEENTGNRSANIVCQGAANWDFIIIFHSSEVWKKTYWPKRCLTRALLEASGPEMKRV